MARVNMEGIENGRHDLFISFHGSEELTNTGLPPGTTTRDLARAVVSKIEEMIQQMGRFPSIFFDETGIRSSLSDIFKAIMQTRGGGVALFLLTKKFFSKEYCLAELRAFMRLQARAGNHVGFKFCFICLDPSVDGLLGDPDIQRKVPNLSEYVIHGDVASRGAMPAVANAIAQMVVDVWNGDNTTGPSNLGSTVQMSFMDLCGSLSSCDIAVAKIVLGVSDPGNRMYTMSEVLHAALSHRTISYSNVELLHGVITRGRSTHAESQREALTAYMDKWCDASSWEWDPDVFVELRFYLPSLMTNDNVWAAFNVPQEANQLVVKTALSHGASKLCSVRVLLLGGSERGKTSTVESLLGHAFVENRPSTRGIDLETHCLAPGLRGLSAEKVRERSSTVDSFAAAVSRSVPQQTSQARPSSGSHHASGAFLDRSNATSRASIPRNAHPTQASDVHHRVFNAATRALRAPVEIRGDNGQLLRIWDFGGQKEYEACHQLFMSQRSVLMLAIDLQKFWCEGTRDDEFAELKPWLRCAFSLTERPASQHVVVVGTRKNTCGDVEGAWEALEDLICKWSSTVYNTWVRAPATGGAAMMKKIALENDGAIFDADGSGLRELEDHLWSITGQIIENSEPVPVKWRALLEELVRDGQDKLFLTKEKVMEVASGVPGFPESTDSLDVTVMEMLRYCRDLGDLILFEMSLPVKGDTCIVFVDPKKLLDVLRTTIGPCKDVCSRLEARQRVELREKGLVDMEALDILWRDVPKSYRFTMLETLCSFDLLVKLEWDEQGQGKVGIPALMPQLGSDADSFVERMGRRHDERDLEVYTIFTEFFPVGLIGVLVANLHSTVGQQRTAVQYIRADAVLLSLSERERVLMKYVQSGHNSMQAHIKWLFRGKEPVEIAHRCLQQFYVLMQSPFRQVIPTSYRHVIVSDCALDLSCCPSNVANCDGHGCGGKESVELEIDSEKLQSGRKRNKLHLQGACCSRSECGVYHDHEDLVADYPIPALPSQPVKQRELGSSVASAGGKADPASAVRKSVADDDSRRTTSVREAAGMPPVSDVDMEHIKHGRYDLFISFHGGEELAQGITTRFIVGEAVKRIREAVRNRGVAPGPSIFFDETEVKGPLTDIFKAVMQTRGGGAALFLLTKAYFARKYCLAELRAFMDMHKRAVDRGEIGVKLYFICLGPSVDDLLNDRNIKKLVPGLPESCIHAFGEEKDVVRAIADAFLGAWEGNNTTPGINLGRDVQESFGHLAVALESVDIDTAMRVLTVRGSSMWRVLDAALAGPYISHYNVEKLHDVITGSRPRPPQSVRNELIAYQRKWCDAEHWKWGLDVLTELCDVVEEAKKDIAEQFPR